MRWEKANYIEAILPEHKGNPLIEALPPKASNEEVMEYFSNYPDLDAHIRNEPNSLVRDEYLSRLKELRQPLPIYSECFRAIERALKAGYSTRNPFSPSTAQYLHYAVEERPVIVPRTGYFLPKGDGITLVGDSGVGKTSMLEQVLNYFPHVIEHEEYKGLRMEYPYQVVWVKVDCPSKSSVRELCEEILACLDNAMRQKRTTPGSTIPKLLWQIEQKIKSSFLGILVIDEMQNLEFKRTGGENNLLKFLHHLVNKLGVPIFFCANPPFDDSLAQTLRNARRAESGGFFKMEPLEKEGLGWESFVAELWGLQWTNVVTELDDELSDKLYELSLGNLDMACRIYREAQRLVIGSEDETISIAVLEHAYTIACGLSSKTDEVLARRQTFKLPRRKREPSNTNHIKKVEKARIVGDFNRPQHPEFEENLRELYLADNLPERIRDPDLIQRAVNEENPIDYLRKQGVLCDDPLQQLLTLG